MATKYFFVIVRGLVGKMLTSLNLTQADCLLNLPSVSLRNVLQELQTRLASKIKTHCQCNQITVICAISLLVSWFHEKKCMIPFFFRSYLVCTTTKRAFDVEQVFFRVTTVALRSYLAG